MRLKDSLYCLLAFLAVWTVLSGSSVRRVKSAGQTGAKSISSKQEEVRKVRVAKWHGPITFTAIRHLEDEGWCRKFQVEIRNDAPKPIYALEMSVTFADIKDDELGNRPHVGFGLRYGRLSLLHGGIAAPDDKPIGRGETHVLKAQEEACAGIEHYIARKNIPESMTKKILIIVDSISYGDGTGFEQGAPYTAPGHEERRYRALIERSTGERQFAYDIFFVTAQ